MVQQGLCVILIFALYGILMLVDRIRTRNNRKPKTFKELLNDR